MQEGSITTTFHTYQLKSLFSLKVTAESAKMQEREILWCNRAVFQEINDYIANDLGFKIVVSYVWQNVV
jgi:hypothetical protein